MTEHAAAIPRHIGYIVDGNRRWAKTHGIPTYEGHLAGYNALKDVAFATLDAGVEYMSIYIFSTENWKRSQDEIRGLMTLILRLFTTDAKVFTENDIRLKVLGQRDGLDPKILKAMDKLEDSTKDNKSGTLAICLNYGGQNEIVDAVKKIVQSGISADEITEDIIAENLYGAEVPPVDVIVRTSGEAFEQLHVMACRLQRIYFLEKAVARYDKRRRNRYNGRIFTSTTTFWRVNGTYIWNHSWAHRAYFFGGRSRTRPCNCGT